MHGNSCGRCQGDGVVPPEQVEVVPDRDAHSIREYLRDHPELQKNEYDTGDEDPLLGLCYPAAEAYYHLNTRDLHAYCLNWADVDGQYEGTRWYLRDPTQQRWIDIALPTMPPVDLPPFEAGTRQGGFITGNEPSQRTQQVLDAVSRGRSA